MTKSPTQEALAGNAGNVIAVRDPAELAVVDNRLGPHTGASRGRLNKSAADLERLVETYPDGVREDTIWVQGFCREHCNGNLELLRAIAAKLGFDRSHSFFYNALHGHAYGVKGKGNHAYWRELVTKLREHDRNALSTGKRGFIETPTYRCIADFIDERRAVNAACKFGIITGPTGSQKSACRKYYRLLNNHGVVVGFEATARQTLAAFERKLGEQYSAKIGNKAAARQAAIRDNVDHRKTILVDNAQRLFIHTAGNKQPIFDYLLELQEDTDCTVILWVCEDFVSTDLEQAAAKTYFEQLVGRFGGLNDILRLPAYTPDADLRVIARAYGLNPKSAEVMKYLTRWSRERGRIRILFHRLARAKHFAQLDKRDSIAFADLEEADQYVPTAIGEEDAS